MDPLDSVRRYFREALESADEAESPQRGVWFAYINRLGHLRPVEVPETIRDQFEMWCEAVAGFEVDDPAQVGTARITTDDMSDADAREMIRALRSMAVEIGAVES